MQAHTAIHAGSPDEPVIDRRDTGIRIALTLLFAIVARILSSIVGLAVVFSLIWSFITKRAPGEGLRSAANRLIAYDYRIARWLTYNEQRVPFPFSDFPDSLEESDWDPELRESDALGFEAGRDDDANDRFDA